MGKLTGAGTGGRSHRTLRAALLVLLAFFATAFALFVAAAVWTWSAQGDEPEHVDAVIVLAYGQDRIDKGVDLVEDGVSDELIMSVSRRMNSMLEGGNMLALTPAEWDQAPPNKRWMPACGEEFPQFETECFTPVPHSTVGEALAVRDMAEENGWDSVAIVTEPSHLNRARAIFEECSGTSVYAVSSGREDGLWRTVWRTVYETAALAKYVVTPACT